jgi:hypothetical protein
MQITQCTRDHRGRYTSKELKACEKFVGKNERSFEEGIDDQYTLFFFSHDCVQEVIAWVLNNKYDVWHLIEDISFTSLDDLKRQVNERGKEFDEDWEELE